MARVKTRRARLWVIAGVSALDAATRIDFAARFEAHFGTVGPTR